MADRAAIEKLKADWENDPCFDLVGIEGFEEHEEELAAFQRQKEQERKQRRDRALQDKAERMGVSLEAAAQIERLEARASSLALTANRTLTHYLSLAGVPTTGDCRAEIDQISEDIIDAAVAKATVEILKLAVLR